MRNWAYELVGNVQKIHDDIFALNNILACQLLKEPICCFLDEQIKVFGGLDKVFYLARVFLDSLEIPHNLLVIFHFVQVLDRNDSL